MHSGHSAQPLQAKKAHCTKNYRLPVLELSVSTKPTFQLTAQNIEDSMRSEHGKLRQA